MKTLSIDIETYSDEPLQKTGVYRYVESPNFEILLFARDFAFKIKSSPFCQGFIWQNGEFLY